MKNYWYLLVFIGIYWKLVLLDIQCILPHTAPAAIKQ